MIGQGAIVLLRRSEVKGIALFGAADGAIKPLRPTTGGGSAPARQARDGYAECLQNQHRVEQQHQRGPDEAG